MLRQAHLGKARRRAAQLLLRHQVGRCQLVPVCDVTTMATLLCCATWYNTPAANLLHPLSDTLGVVVYRALFRMDACQHTNPQRLTSLPSYLTLEPKPLASTMPALLAKRQRKHACSVMRTVQEDRLPPQPVQAAASRQGRHNSLTRRSHMPMLTQCHRWRRWPKERRWLHSAQPGAPGSRPRV